MTQKLFKGDTLGRILYFKNENNVLIDPTTVTIKMIDPSGNQSGNDITLSDLTKTATGTYKLTWNVPSDAETGLWTMKVTATYVGDLQNTEEFTFIVEES